MTTRLKQIVQQEDILSGDYIITRRKYPSLRKSFIWIDKDNNQHSLSSITDQYLQNIINHLEKLKSCIPPFEDQYQGDELWTMIDNEYLMEAYGSLINFLKYEQNKRNKNGPY